jgi:hypothetical protein
MDADAGLKLVISEPEETGHELDLRVIAVGEKKLFMIGVIKIRKHDKWMGMPALLQNLNNQLAHQGFGGGRRFDQDAVAGRYACGMFDQYFCEFLNS